jgi:hypothetical protein
MNKRLVYLLIGFVASLAIVLTLTFYLAKSEPIQNEDTDSQKILSSDDFKQFDKDTKDLKNNGNAPITVSGEDIGRGNPFEAY